MARSGEKTNPPPTAGGQIFVKKKQLREINARMEGLRALIAANLEELRRLRATMAEHRVAAQGLNNARASAREEQSALEVAREKLKAELDLAPEPDDGAS